MARTLPPQTQLLDVSPDDEAAAAAAAEPQPAAVPGPQRSRRPAVAGAIGGAWAFGVGLGLVTCLVMLAWAVSPNSAGDSSTAWRAAGLTWLGAHLVPLQVAGQPLTLLPIGGLLLGLLLTRRSGAWTGRLLPEPSPGEVGWIAAGAAALYGSGGAVVAWLSAAPATYAVPARAALVTGVVAALGTAWGIGREAGLMRRARARVPDATWRTLAAALTVVVGLLGAGAALVTASLVAHFATVGATLADLDAGGIGAAGLTLLDAASLPNLAIWAASVIVGPGFTLGSLGSLSAFGGEVGALPALPVLAAIPTTMPGWAPMLLVVPVLLGVLAGRIRWGRDLPTPLGALTAALVLGGAVAALLAGVMWLASGSLGDGRLADVGPVLLPAVAAGTGLMVLGFLLEAGFQSARLSWDLHRAEQRAAALRADRDEVEPAATEVVVEVAPEPGPPPAAAAPAAALPRHASRGHASPSAVGVRGVAAALASRLVGAGGPMSGSAPDPAGSVAPGPEAVVDVRDGLAHVALAHEVARVEVAHEAVEEDPTAVETPAVEPSGGQLQAAHREGRPPGSSAALADDDTADLPVVVVAEADGQAPAEAPPGEA